LQAVAVCWTQKQGSIAEIERQEAKKDYENAKKIYQKIIEESK
jgi:hypothetical protein